MEFCDWSGLEKRVGSINMAGKEKAQYPDLSLCFLGGISCWVPHAFVRTDEPIEFSEVLWATCKENSSAQYFEVPSRAVLRHCFPFTDALDLNAEEKAVLIASTKSPISFLSKLGQTISRKRSPKVNGRGFWPAANLKMRYSDKDNAVSLLSWYRIKRKRTWMVLERGERPVSQKR